MNNLKELFEIQAGLDAEILKNHPIQPGEDRLEKKHAALLVELGETMNEIRQFKFWSNDRKPRTNVTCRKCKGAGSVLRVIGEEKGMNVSQLVTCDECQGVGKCDYVLKELVDCLHFALSIGLDVAESYLIVSRNVAPTYYEEETIEKAFLYLIQTDWVSDSYELALDHFLGFCEKLGYTWEQVTAAYLEKNQENHYRQMRGY